ncbi:hypothetical protein ACVI1L_004594 [Bradyrhizobium sp. USDA 4516]|nr:hypothetical protein [Bradyrhizobium sp. USDA 4541]
MSEGALIYSMRNDVAEMLSPTGRRVSLTATVGARKSIKQSA